MGLGEILSFYDFGGGYDPGAMTIPALMDLGGAPLDLSAPAFQASAWTDAMSPAQQSIDMWLGGDTLDGGAPSEIALADLRGAASPMTESAIARMQEYAAGGAAPTPSDLNTLYSGFAIPASPADLGVQNGLGLLLSPQGQAIMREGALGARGFSAPSGGSSGGNGSSSGGGGNLGLSMPRIDAPGAAEVPAHAVPNQPGVQAAPPFVPMQFDTRTPADDTTLKGLERLLRRGR